MLTVAAGTKKMKSRAQRYWNGATWAGKCAAFVYRMTGSTIAYASANLAFHDSKIIGLDASTATTGAVHFWTDSSYGHTAVAYGGKHAAMASIWVSGNGTEWGVRSGVVDVDAYNAAHPDLQYRGWAPAYGRNRMMAGLIIVVKVTGDPRLWLITETTRHHLTPAEWRPLKRRGVRAKPTTPGLLAQFAVV